VKPPLKFRFSEAAIPHGVHPTHEAQIAFLRASPGRCGKTDFVAIPEIRWRNQVVALVDATTDDLSWWKTDNSLIR
jgi:hypothetical protein